MQSRRPRHPLPVIRDGLQSGLMAIVDFAFGVVVWRPGISVQPCKALRLAMLQNHHLPYQILGGSH
jgi:hypothetical protein